MRLLQDRFGIEYSEDLKSSVKFVHLKKRGLVEADRYPRFTMLGQSLGSMLMTWEALRAYNPDVFIDTTGFAFSYLLAKGVAQCRVIAYTHYPTITAVRCCTGALVACYLLVELHVTLTHTMPIHESKTGHVEACP